MQRKERINRPKGLSAMDKYNNFQRQQRTHQRLLRELRRELRNTNDPAARSILLDELTSLAYKMQTNASQAYGAMLKSRNYHQEEMITSDAQIQGLRMELTTTQNPLMKYSKELQDYQTRLKNSHRLLKKLCSGIVTSQSVHLTLRRLAMKVVKILRRS